MKKFFAMLALTGMMVAVSAPAVFAASGKSITVLGIDDKKDKEKKSKKKKDKACKEGEGKSCCAKKEGEGKACSKGDGKSCCKGHDEKKEEKKGE